MIYYQTFGGKDVYPSIEEKSANLLYLTVKNHAFIDGNKRIATTIFIYFLQVLIAESNPKEKEIMIDLIMNFLK